MLALGRKFERGDGVRSSALQAAAWYARAAEAGNAEAGAELVGLRGY